MLAHTHTHNGNVLHPPLFKSRVKEKNEKKNYAIPLSLMILPRRDSHARCLQPFKMINTCTPSFLRLYSLNLSAITTLYNSYTQRVAPLKLCDKMSVGVVTFGFRWLLGVVNGFCFNHCEYFMCGVLHLECLAYIQIKGDMT